MNGWAHTVTLPNKNMVTLAAGPVINQVLDEKWMRMSGWAHSNTAGRNEPDGNTIALPGGDIIQVNADERGVGLEHEVDDDDIIVLHDGRQVIADERYCKMMGDIMSII